MNNLSWKQVFFIAYIFATLMAFKGYTWTGHQVAKFGTWLSNVKAEIDFK